MDYWQQLITIILTPTLSVAALAWILKALFSSGLQEVLWSGLDSRISEIKMAEGLPLNLVEVSFFIFLQYSITPAK